MAFSCRLTRNISVTQDGSSSCEANDLAVGGIMERFYIFNIDDIQGLKFLNDERSDDSLYIDTINTSQPYYYVDAASVTYNETQEGDTYTHTLTATVNSVNPIIQDIISDAAPGKYLVCFRPKGSTDYRCFGWKEGAELSHTFDIDESSNSYTLTFSDESEFPLFTVKADNFDLANKQFDPIWQPLYDVTYCELDEHGMQTGWCLARYVVKTNTAGQALDEDNKLCEYSGKLQDAYKLQGVVDGNYHIIGTYGQDAVFEGKPVRIFDPVLCLIETSGTISFSEDTVRLNSTTRQTASVNLTSNSAWAIVSEAPEYCTVAPSEGEGNAVMNFYYSRWGGDDVVKVRNLNSYEETTINVHNRTLITYDNLEFENGTTNFSVYCKAYGGSENYTWQVDAEGLSITEAYNTEGDTPVLVALDCTVIDPSVTSERQWTFTFTHADDNEEVKTCTVTIFGVDQNPYWRLLSKVCEETSSN